MSADSSARNASISISNKVLKDEKTTKEILNLAAFHECCEVKFYKIREYLLFFYNDIMCDELIHEQIKFLQNTLYKYIKFVD